MKSRLLEDIPPPHQSKPSEHSKPKSEISIEKYKNKLIIDVQQDIILEKPKVLFSDIVGQERATKALQERVVLPSRYPHLFTGNILPAPGFLLYGPSGTGKRLLIQACAYKIDAPFFLLEARDLLMLEPQKALEKLQKTFAAAKAAAPSIVYLGDITPLVSEMLTREFSQAWKSFKYEYLKECNCHSLEASKVTTLITTQKPWLLDSYPRRKLTQTRIYFPLPDESDRKDLLKKFLNHSGHALWPSEDQEYLVKETKGFSAAEIQEFVRQACYEPIREAHRSNAFKVCGELSDGAPVYQACEESDLEANKMSLLDIPGKQLKLREVSRGDFERVRSQILPLTDELEISKYEEWTKEFTEGW